MPRLNQRLPATATRATSKANQVRPELGRSAVALGESGGMTLMLDLTAGYSLMLLRRDRAGLFPGREVFRDRQRHLASGGPLCAARQRGQETDAAHAIGVVAHRRVEHAALAVHHGPDHRLVLAGAALAL